MVATRRSIPAASSDVGEDADEDEIKQESASAEPEPEKQDKRVKNALRKLEIDGTAALAGNRVSRRQTAGTYHYRGAVYNITADTPKAWIEQQPPRYRRSESESTLHSSKRKLQEVEDVEAEENPKPVKRTRHMEQSSMRRRRSTATYNTRSTTVAEGNTEDRQRQMRRRDRGTDQLTTHRYSDLMARITSAQAVAREKGYEVEPLEQSESSVKEERFVRNLTRGLIQLGKTNTRYTMLSDLYQKLKSRGEFNARLRFTRKPDKAHEEVEEGDDEEEETMLQMPKPADIALATHYDSPASASAQLLEPDSPENSSTHESPSSSHSSPMSGPNGAAKQQTSVAHSPLPKAAASPTPGRRPNGDSAERQPGNSTAELNSNNNDDNSAATAGATQEENQPSLLNVPAHLNRLYQLSKKLGELSRLPPIIIPFSAAATTTTTTTQATAQKPPESKDLSRRSPQLSEKLHDDERAENAIHEHRRASETPGAFRRRVRRELAMVRSWPPSDQN